MGTCVFAQQAGSPAAHVTSVKLRVNVDHSANCKLSLSASIAASELGTIWYRYSGPAGTTFDFGDEGTKTLEFDRFFGDGRGAKMAADIHGVLRVEAGMVDASGKHGAALSDSVPADYTCGNGSTIASPIPPLSTSQSPAAPAPSTQNRPAASPGFQVMAVKAGNYTAKFKGSCPTNDMTFRWELTANGSGSAVVRLMQESRLIREETVTFSGPGTKVVTYRAPNMGAPGGHYQGWIGLAVLSPKVMVAGHEAYTLQCAPRAK
jgi:hypothetical protein